VAKQNGISPLIVEDADGKTQALVDKKDGFSLFRKWPNHL
jgi:isoleucyl-tRNA synthetase